MTEERKDYDWMPEAREIAAQCWCDEETSATAIDTVLCESVARRIAKWMQTGALHARNEDYWRNRAIEAECRGVPDYVWMIGTKGFMALFATEEAANDWQQMNGTNTPASYIQPVSIPVISAAPKPDPERKHEIVPTLAEPDCECGAVASEHCPACEPVAQEQDEFDDRYKVVRTGFWWRVRIGDGQQTVGRCYTETEAQRLAAALLTAFRDGQFVSSPPVAQEPEKANPVQETVQCKHDFVMDNEHPRHSCCQKCGAVRSDHVQEPVGITYAEAETLLSVHGVLPMSPNQTAEIEQLQEELMQEISEGIDNDKRWQQRIAELERQRDVLAKLLCRYRNETPPGHQPHMIAHEVDAALASVKGNADVTGVTTGENDAT